MTRRSVENRYKVDTDVPVGYKCRWSQQGFTGTTTGDTVYRDLEECLDLCVRVNMKWGPSGIQQWPVKYKLNETGVAVREIEDLRHLVVIQ